MLRNQLLWLFYTIRNKYDQRREAKEAAQRAKAEAKRTEQETRAAAQREYAERVETQNFLFLAMLQTMVKVCEEIKPMPWVTRYNGWLRGDAVRAMTDENDPTKPIYEICLQDPKWYREKLCNIDVYQQTPEFEHIYSKDNLFVPDNKLPYLKAVFDLTARRNISSPKRAQTLQELKNIKIEKSMYWNDYPEAHAIKYLEGLLPKNQSK